MNLIFPFFTPPHKSSLCLCHYLCSLPPFAFFALSLLTTPRCFYYAAMPSTKRVKNLSAGAAAARAEEEKVSGWERSKFSAQDQRKMKKMGLLMNDEKIKIPGDEVILNPPEGY
jgi:hypothetical protein